MSDKPKEFSLEGLDKLADKNKAAAIRAEVERLQKIERAARKKLNATFAPMTKSVENRGDK